MIKVGIVTIQSINYGNRLQNFALQEALRKLGCESFTFHREVKKKGISFLKTEVKKCAQILVGSKGSKFTIFDSKIRFAKEYLTFDCCTKGLENKYDFFVAGSDQIWNPSYIGDLTGEADLLSFAAPSQRIAYAASFGVNELPKNKEKYYASELRQFKAISVREEQGKKIVKKLIGKDATLVLDPTLLITSEEWLEVARKPCCAPDEPFILCYYLGTKDDAFLNELSDLKKKYGCVVLDVFKKRKMVKK